MSDDFRIQRHAEIAEQKSKSIKRVCLAGLVFGSVVLVNVLNPYSSFFEESQQMNEAAEQTSRQLAATEASLEATRELGTIVEKTRETMRSAPWDLHRRELIETYRGLSAASPDVYQRLADETVSVIAAEVRQLMRPLQEALDTHPEIDRGAIEPRLGRVLASIGTWETGNFGRDWYATLEGKRRTLESLSDSIEQDMQGVAAEIASSIDELSSSVEASRSALAAEVARLDAKRAQQNEDLRALDTKMQAVLPAWLQGMIDIEDMVQAYPLIILCVAGYLLFTGITLTQHHESVAVGRGWSPQERHDPLYSPAWALVYRGRLGTLTTLVLYSAVFAVAAIFVKAGGDILMAWVDSGHGGALSRSAYQAMLYGIYGLLVVGLGIVLSRTLRRLPSESH